MFFYQFLREIHPFLRVHQMDMTVGITRTTTVSGRKVITDYRTAYLAFLSRNHDYPIGSLYPIKRSGRGIFQHVNTVNVFGIQSSNSIAYAIYIIRIVQFLRLNGHRVLDDNPIYNPQRLAVTD